MTGNNIHQIADKHGAVVHEHRSAWDALLNLSTNVCRLSTFVDLYDKDKSAAKAVAFPDTHPSRRKYVYFVRAQNFSITLRVAV